MIEPVPPNPIVTDAVSARVVAELSWDQFCERVESFEEAERALPFWIGDLVNYGLDRWGDDTWQAVKVRVGNARTAQNYAWVCRRFPPEHRHPALTMSFHMTLASLAYVTPAIAGSLLSAAYDNGWTVDMLREQATLTRAVLKEAAVEAKKSIAAAEPVSERVQGIIRASGHMDAPSLIAAVDRHVQQAIPSLPTTLVDNPHRAVCPTCSCLGLP